VRKIAAVLLSLLLSTAAHAIERVPLTPELRLHVSRDTLQVVRFPYRVYEAYVDASKGIQVQAQGNNLLIKWNPYYKKPAVIAITLIDDKGKTHDYTIVAIPDRNFPEVIEAYLPKEAVEEQKRKKAARFEKSMPYEELLVSLVKSFMLGTYPDYYSVEKTSKPLGVFKEIDVYLEEIGRGDKFTVLKGRIVNKLSRPVRIDETVLSFLAKRYDVRAISVRHHTLPPGGATTFVVVVASR
jgi:hypothetical protein